MWYVPEDLRGYVPRSPAVIQQPKGRDVPGIAEAREFEGCILLERVPQEILGSQVAMGHRFLVAVRYSSQQGAYHLPCVQLAVPILREKNRAARSERCGGGEGGGGLRQVPRVVVPTKSGPTDQQVIYSMPLR